jgi:hypothetical protein
LLVNASPYLRAAFGEDRFIEGTNGILHLPEEDPKIFLLILRGLHQGTLCEENIPEQSKSWETFITLHVAIDRYDLPALKNNTMDLFTNLMKVEGDYFIQPTCEDLILAYRNTVPSSPLRKLLSEPLACMFSVFLA